MKKVCPKHELAYEAGEGCTYCVGAIEDKLREAGVKSVKQCTSKSFEPADDDDTRPMRRIAAGTGIEITTPGTVIAASKPDDEASFANIFDHTEPDPMPGYDANGTYDGFDDLLDIQVKVVHAPVFEEESAQCARRLSAYFDVPEYRTNADKLWLMRYLGFDLLTLGGEDV